MVPSVRLVELAIDRHAEWAAMVAEFDGGPMDGSGVSGSTRIDTSSVAFAQYMGVRRREGDVTRAPDPGRVHCTYWWIERGGELAGFMALRHELNDFLREQGGHIGYSVRPSMRRCGVATAALRAAVGRARGLGLSRVLVTCDEGNIASRRTIEACDGVHEDSRHGKRRYWIDVGN